MTRVNTRSRSLPLRVAGTVLLLAGLAGCGGDAPADPPSSSTSPTETGGPTPDDATDEATEEPTETVSPATGEVVSYRQFSVTVPAGWKVGRDLLYVRSIDSPPAPQQIRKGEPYGFVTLAVGPADRRSLDQLAREAVADGEGERVEDHELDGETVFHVSRPDQAFETNEVFGLWRDGEQITISFSMIESTVKKRQAIVESVLATWEWQP